MTTSTPSPSWLSSKSRDERRDLDKGVGVEDRPVISQSIQTIRSVWARSTGWCGMGQTIGVLDRWFALMTAPALEASTRRPPQQWASVGAHLGGHRGLRRGEPLALALLVSTYMGAAFGVQAALLALLVSAVPLLIVIPTFIWLDRFEAEPTRYLVAAFLWGPWRPSSRPRSTPPAMAVIQATVGESDAVLATAVLVAPFVEEAAKGFRPLRLVVPAS